MHGCLRARLCTEHRTQRTSPRHSIDVTNAPRFEPLERRELLAAYVVSTTGSDLAAGTAAAPWRTLQKAADTVAAGDTVTVRPGTYAGMDLFADGTPTARITFTAEPGVLVNERNRRTNDGINLEGANYVTIEGFSVQGVPRAGIRSVINTGAIIRNNQCDSNGVWGILTGFSENVLIEGNVTTRSGSEHGIYVSNSADNPVIRNNTSWGNRGNGIHMNGDIEAGGGDGIISNALVEGNVIYDNGVGGGSGINCDGVQNSRIVNNLLYNNHASGISLYRIDGGGSSTGNTVVNNTVVMASNGRWALNIQDASTGNVVFNNVFYHNGSFPGSMDVSSDSLPGMISDCNAVMDRFTTNGGDTRLTLAQWRAATGQDANSFVATPAQLFVNAGGGDYHLKPGSPALNTGIAALGGRSAPAADREGTPRPSGTGFDIGSDELAVAPPPATVTSVVMNDGNAQRSAVKTITVQFDSAVVLDADAITVIGRNGAGTGVVLDVAPATGVANAFVLSFTGSNVFGGSLPDGVYDLRVVASRVHAGSASGPTMTADHTLAFHRLFSDADGDGDSDNADLFQMRGAYGTSEGATAYRWYFDYEADGDVDNADVFQVRSRRSVTFVYV